MEPYTEYPDQYEFISTQNEKFLILNRGTYETTIKDDKLTLPLYLLQRIRV